MLFTSEQYMISKKVIFIVIIVLTILLTACNDKNDTEESIPDEIVEGEASVDRSVIESYLYKPHRIEISDNTRFVNGALVHAERIYYWYVDSHDEIVVVNISYDGEDTQETRISTDNLKPAGVNMRVNIYGLHVTNEGNIAVVMFCTFANDDNTIIYNIYDPQGEMISSVDISQNFAMSGILFWLEEVVFIENGKLAILARNEHGKEFILLNAAGTEITRFPVDFEQNIASMADGRLALLLQTGNECFLRIINTETGSPDDDIPLPIPGIKRILHPGNTRQFDILLNDNYILYGYSINDMILTPLLNWMEADINLVPGYFIGLLPEDRIAVFYTDSVYIGGNFEFIDDLFILIRNPRPDMEDRITITLGGLWIPDDIRREIIIFNRENPDYEIELIDYRLNSEWDAADMRFNVEMITGRGPDIIIESYDHHNFNDYLLDLYPFIDGDTDIDRNDFFQNVLQILEEPDGTMLTVTNSFQIRTMLALRETAEHIYPLTFDKLLTRLNESPDLILTSQWLNRESFLTHSLIFSDTGFIDFSTNRAYLDSDEFIDLLEISSRLSQPEHVYHYDVTPEYEKFMKGEQLLYYFFFMEPEQLHMYNARFGDIVAVGLPTNTGGYHAVNPGTGLSINAGTNHPEAAWSFIRRILMPEYSVQSSIPLRIDKYEKLIEKLMTPTIVDGIEQPRKMSWGRNNEFLIYAMTDEEAAVIRDIIESAGMQRQYNDTIMTIIQEDAELFFEGHRSVEDTVRIMQNRVQTYLNEQG